MERKIHKDLGKDNCAENCGSTYTKMPHMRPHVMDVRRLWCQARLTPQQTVKNHGGDYFKGNPDY